MTVINDVAPNDTRLAMEPVAVESRAANADVSTARFIGRASRVNVTIVDFVTARLFFFFGDYQIQKKQKNNSSSICVNDLIK